MSTKSKAKYHRFLALAVVYTIIAAVYFTFHRTGIAVPFIDDFHWIFRLVMFVAIITNQYYMEKAATNLNLSSLDKGLGRAVSALAFWAAVVV